MPVEWQKRKGMAQPVPTKFSASRRYQTQNMPRKRVDPLNRTVVTIKRESLYSDHDDDDDDHGDGFVLVQSL